MKKLETLLYRKKILEYLLAKGKKGIDVYVGYTNEIKKALKNKDYKTKLDKFRLEAELIDVMNTATNYITSFKTNKREYVDYLIPDFDELSDKEKKGIEFEEVNKKVDKLIKYDLYGKTSLKPANIEHVEIIEDIKVNIVLLDNLIKESDKVLKSNINGLEKAKLEKDLYDYKLHIVTLEKRLLDREEYYYNVFKPQFNIELKEANQKLAKMLDIGKQIVELNVDPKLTFLLQEYDKHKDEDEKLWLFYTALKSRLEKIAKFMRRNKNQFKGKMFLADKKNFE